jgi:Mu-like prophage I protein
MTHLLANDQNEHVENPAANVGEVLGIEDDKKTGKVYALIDARKHEGDFGKTILGASAFLHLNYKNSKTNKRVGPTLLHVAATNRPYVTGLDPYEQVVAASAEYLGEPALMQMSGGNDREGSMPRSLDEVLAELRTDHEIDVDALRTQLSAVEKEKTDEAAKAKAAEDKLTSTTTKLAQALSGSEEGAKLSAGDVSSEDVVNAVAELAQRNVALSAAQEASVDRIAALEKRNVEVEIDGLISEGRILPAKREVFLTMALTSREMFDQVIPDEPIVALNAEKGTAPRADEHKGREFDVEAELARLTAPGGAAAEYVRS